MHTQGLNEATDYALVAIKKRIDGFVVKTKSMKNELMLPQNDFLGKKLSELEYSILKT